MKKPISTFLGFVVVVSGLSATGSAFGQDARWNSLFDRIIRLEAQVRSMSSGGAVRGQPPGNTQMRRLLNDVASMRQQLLEMDARLRRLEKAGGRRGNYVAPKVKRRKTTRLVAPAVPFANTDIEEYGINSDISNGTQSYVVMGEPEAPVEPAFKPRRLPSQPPAQWQGAAPATPSYNNQRVANAPAAPGGVERKTLDGNQFTQVSAAQVLFDRASSNYRSRRFGSAEADFKSFVRKNPKHKLAANAQFMIGEIYYVQKNWRLAAQTYLKGYRKYPRSAKAGDTLFKLGKSLGKLGQKSQSCGAFETVVSKYRKTNAARLAKKELRRAKC